jgi:hypothetical protein
MSRSIVVVAVVVTFDFEFGIGAAAGAGAAIDEVPESLPDHGHVAVLWMVPNIWDHASIFCSHPLKNWDR